MAAKSKIPASYILITPTNRKFSVKKGRTMYVMTDKLGKIAEFDIRPRLREGWFEFGPYKCKVTEDEDPTEYARSFDHIITLLISEKKLYFDPDKPLIIYKVNDKEKR